jgi:hypothetical protein
VSAGRVLNRWLDLWGQQAFRITTPLPPDAAGARVRDALTELPTAMRARYPWFRVHLRSRGTELVFRASSRRNNLASLVRARVVPTGTGCDVVGSYGWPLWIRLVTGAWLGGFLLLWGGMLESVVTRDAVDGPVAVLVVVPLMMVAFSVVVVGAAGARGRREAILALDHIAACLAQTSTDERR